MSTQPITGGQAVHNALKSGIIESKMGAAYGRVKKSRGTYTCTMGYWSKLLC